MTKRQFRINLLLLSALLMGAFMLPFVRDQIRYRSYSTRIERDSAQLRVGMSEVEVRTIMGEPDEVTENEDGRFLAWEAREHQGDAFRKAGLWTWKGHYGIYARFDETKRVVRIEGGVN